MAPSSASAESHDINDRAAALRAFEETKAGVKGLVEAGVTTLPSIFRHTTTTVSSASPSDTTILVPIVDLSLPNAAALVCAAAREWGFFQVTNHGIPLQDIDAAISAVRSFHDLPVAARSLYYSRRPIGGVSYYSNLDLFRSAAAGWRDTLQIMLAPERPEIPEVCRTELEVWDGHATEVARGLLRMLSEGMGSQEVEAGRLSEGMGSLDWKVMSCPYYPPCPEPEMAVGFKAHTDPGVLTVLVQDRIGGLQVRRRGGVGVGEVWVDVKPLHGALVINVGDLLQIFSNDEYKSVQHRVVANPHQEARVSIAIFLRPVGSSDLLYGPLPELVSGERPSRYRNFTMEEFFHYFINKEISTKSLLNYFGTAAMTTQEISEE